MARPKKKPDADIGVNFPQLPPPGLASPGVAETTGRFVVLFKENVETSRVKSTMSKVAGIKEMLSAVEYADGAVAAEAADDTAAVHLPRLGIVILGDDEAVRSLATATADADSPILAIEPEYVAYATSWPAGPPLEYLRGYRDAVNHLYEGLARRGVEDGFDAEAAAVFADNAQFTWGLQATRVNTSRYSGQGVRVAVLDTGFDLHHPDFAGRAVVSHSFVSGQAVQDGNGHGTHCIGTACGPQRPAGTRRYGVAYGAQIYAGKVLSNQGSGRTGDIVMGIEWAVTNGCQVVSMSLGANIDQPVQQYEVPIGRALAAGTLVVAAAGNNADRANGRFGFVTPPANAQNAMAVAALDFQLRVANFSARSSTVTGDPGKVNIAGPGVDVYSSWPMATRYRSISGTSMATPHVAGIAALWNEATGATGAALWAQLLRSASALPAASADVGSGFVQAPQ